jgi:hypothetical protein
VQRERNGPSDLQQQVAPVDPVLRHFPRLVAVKSGKMRIGSGPLPGTWGYNRWLAAEFTKMIRKLKSGKYRLYSRKPDPRSGKRRNLGTFRTRAAAEQHERAVQFFKRRG